MQTLSDHLNEFKHYESLVRQSVQPLVNDLRKTEVGKTL